MRVQLRIDDRQLRKYLRKFPDQVDFAQSQVLNETAFDVRRHIVKNVWPRSVSVKARGFAGRAFRVRKANKRDLLAAVFADPSRVAPEGIEAIKRMEGGQRHFPFRGRFLAIPQPAVLTATGRLKKAGRLALQERTPNTFVADLKGRGPAIWQRTRRGLKLLFVLKPSVPTPPDFPFTREADRKARAIWPGKIRKAAIRAVRTAIR